MSDFKDMVQADIKEIFLNFDEFGEIHTINGEEVLIIVDENELTEREKRTQAKDGELHRKQLLFYVSTKDFGALPSPGKLLVLDGKKYTITDAENEMGIYSISLEANRS